MKVNEVVNEIICLSPVVMLSSRDVDRASALYILTSSAVLGPKLTLNIECGILDPAAHARKLGVG